MMYVSHIYFSNYLWNAQEHLSMLCQVILIKTLLSVKLLHAQLEFYLLLKLKSSQAIA